MYDQVGRQAGGELVASQAGLVRGKAGNQAEGQAEEQGGSATPRVPLGRIEN
jgi:hypothetical protein